MLSNLTICLALRLRMLSRRSGTRAVDVGGLTLEIRRKSRYIQKSKFVNWGAGMSIGPGPAITNLQCR